MVKCVYVDVLFVMSVMANYLILASTGKLTGRRIIPKRLFAASLAGAAYAILAVTSPCLGARAIWVRLLCGLLMVFCAYPSRDVLSYATAAISFYLCAFLAAGTAMLLSGWQTDVVSRTAAAPGSETPVALRFLVLACSFGVLGMFPIMARAGGFRPGRSLPLVGFEMQVDGQVIGLVGLVDTGNSLRDPVSGLPVIVVEWESLREIMPADTDSFFLSTWDALPESLSCTEMGKRLRLIPYRSLAGRLGVLPGFRPDALTLCPKGARRIERNAVIGVLSGRLSPAGSYQALLHPDLVDP